MKKKGLANKKRRQKKRASFESCSMQSQSPPAVFLAALLHRIKPPVRVDAFSRIYVIIKAHAKHFPQDPRWKKGDMFQAISTLLADNMLVNGGECYSQGPNWRRARKAYDGLQPGEQAMIMWLAEQINNELKG